MHIEYKHGIFLGLTFNNNELQLGYIVVKWLQTQLQSNEQVETILHNLEIHLNLKPKPKLLTLVVDHHLCEKCMMMIDTKKDRHKLTTKGGNSVYTHLQCPVDPPPPLKE